MRAFIQIHLFGSLRELGISKNKASFRFELNDPMTPMEVADCLNISKDLIQMVMVNNRAVMVDTLINPGDRIAFFPKEYPLFADWKVFHASAYLSLNELSAAHR